MAYFEVLSTIWPYFLVYSLSEALLIKEVECWYSFSFFTDIIYKKDFPLNMHSSHFTGICLAEAPSSNHVWNVSRHSVTLSVLVTKSLSQRLIYVIVFIAQICVCVCVCVCVYVHKGMEEFFKSARGSQSWRRCTRNVRLERQNGCCILSGTFCFDVYLTISSKNRTQWKVKKDVFFVIVLCFVLSFLVELVKTLPIVWKYVIASLSWRCYISVTLSNFSGEVVF